MKTPDLDKHLRVLRELEDENQHPEWLVYYAEHLARDRKLAKAADAARVLQDHFGGLIKPLREVREKLYAQARYLFHQRDPEAFLYAGKRGV